MLKLLGFGWVLPGPYISMRDLKTVRADDETRSRSSPERLIFTEEPERPPTRKRGICMA